jgi:hypothetical protein
LKKKRFLQYPGGVQDPSTSGFSTRLTDEELNTLSYLVGKYPKETMKHLNGHEMFRECIERGLFSRLKEEDECGKNTDM